MTPLPSKGIRIAVERTWSAVPGLVLGMVLGTLLSNPVYAGGADVSLDEIYSDGVTLTTFNGLPLDINGDRIPDLVVAANRGHPAGRSRYYLGNGDGTFRDGARLVEGASSFIAAADMNGDTFIDLVQARRDLTELLYPGDGVGGFNAAIDVSIDTTRTLELAIGDLNNDGFLDIVTANGHQGGIGSNPLQPNRFYLNNGLGEFVGAEISADADDSRAIALADLDLDGDLDVIVGNDETTPNSNRIYLNQFIESGSTAVSFAPGINFGTANDQAAKILIGDLNNNGKPDIVVLNHVSLPQSPGINRFYLNESTPGNLVLSAEMDISADTDDTADGVLADFDGDGDLDLIVVNLLASGPGQSSRTRLYRNQFMETGTVSFAPGVDISPDEQMSRSVAAVDLNGNGHIDLVVGNQDLVDGVSGRDRRYLNNGTADPFANVVPVINAQAGPLETDEQTDLTILLEDVTVTDADNVFPDDFTLTVQEGTNYTVTGNTITPDLGFHGTLTVPVIVSDGTDDSDPFDLSVTVNDTINNPPAFTSTPILGATEGAAYSYDITATDPDVGSVLTITATTAPAWLTFTDNGGGSATLTGTPGASDVGDHAVSLTVSDGAATDVQDFTITVAAAPVANTPPEFTSTAITAATEGTAYTYDVTATDADAGDVLVMTAPTLPAWLTFTDNGGGSATLTGTPDAGDVGDHAVSLQVSDGTDTATQDFTITVEEDATVTPPPAPPPPRRGGGGSLGFLSLLALGTFVAVARRRRRD